MEGRKRSRRKGGKEEEEKRAELELTWNILEISVDVRKRVDQICRVVRCSRGGHDGMGGGWGYRLKEEGEGGRRR